MTDAKDRELELIDGMIGVQLHHAEQCDRIANRTMAEKQKAWDMERVALLRKMRAALAQPVEPVAWISPAHHVMPAELFDAWRKSTTAEAATWKPLYLAPPAPAAVPLTDEQFDNLVGKVAQIKATMTIDGVKTLGMFGAEEAINIVLDAVIAAAGDKP